MFTSGPTVHMCLQSISRSFDNMVREGGRGLGIEQTPLPNCTL